MSVEPETTEALRLLDLVHGLARSVTDEARDAVADVADLDLGEFLLLRQVAAGEATPGELSRQLHAHPTVTSRTITRLARAGLVERRPDAQDSRRLRIELTDHGRSVVDRIAAAVRPSLQSRLDRLEPGESAAVVRALERLVRAS